MVKKSPRSEAFEKLLRCWAFKQLSSLMLYFIIPTCYILPCICLKTMFLSQLWSWSFSFYIPYNHVGQKSQGHIYLFRYKPSLPPFYPHCSLLSLLLLYLPFPFLSFPILPTYPFLLPVSHAPFSPRLFLLLSWSKTSFSLLYLSSTLYYRLPLR